MTTPRFEPRNFAEHPQLFGRYEVLRWKDIGMGDIARADQLGAAKIQHAIAWRMLRAIKERPDYRTIERYARAVGGDPTRIGRMLRGTIVMRIEDMVNAERNLGVAPWRGAAFDA